MPRNLHVTEETTISNEVFRPSCINIWDLMTEAHFQWNIIRFYGVHQNLHSEFDQICLLVWRVESIPFLKIAWSNINSTATNPESTNNFPPQPVFQDAVHHSIKQSLQSELRKSHTLFIRALPPERHKAGSTPSRQLPNPQCQVRYSSRIVKPGD